MAATLDIRRNDTVKVIAGRDKGKTGRVLRVLIDKNKVLVEHVMVVKKTMSSKRNPKVKGGIAEQESPIAISNVMLMCGSCNRPARIGHEVRGDRKTRVCKSCGNTLEK